tara:strand:- start:3596 stop:4297 length:702 start_codon:yes stop_codon:yes gene_type:complete
MMSLKRQRLIKRLGYTFTDESLLDLALTHRSCGARNNERLEFLGDSILNFTMGEALFNKFPAAREGDLSRLRAQLVKGETLAEVAREFELGEQLNLGEGEIKSGGFRRDSILADTVEAIIGAIYLEAGMDVCQRHLLDWYAKRVRNISLDETRKDSKTQLQEYLQSCRAPVPEYKIIATSGESHAQQFTVECRVKLLPKPTVATASNRKLAEKESAAEALNLLQAQAVKLGKK